MDLAAWTCQWKANGESSRVHTHSALLSQQWRLESSFLSFVVGTAKQSLSSDVSAPFSRAPNVVVSVDPVTAVVLEWHSLAEESNSGSPTRRLGWSRHPLYEPLAFLRCPSSCTPFNWGSTNLCWPLNLTECLQPCPSNWSSHGNSGVSVRERRKEQNSGKHGPMLGIVQFAP